MQTKNTDSKTKKAHPILNDKYEVVSSLGDGKTSRVYLCRDVKDQKIKVAMKLFRDEYLTKNPKNKKTVENEIQILKELNHKSVIRLQDYGMNGVVKK